jgi:hypothetical protein
MFIPICSAVHHNTVFYIADKWEFLRANMASSSKEGLGIIDISDMLASNELINS